MHDAALVVPLVLAAELDAVTRPQLIDARRQIDVVGNQDGLSRIRPNQEPLMPRSLHVIDQDPDNGTGRSNPHIAASFLESFGQGLYTLTVCRRRCGPRRTRRVAEELAMLRELHNGGQHDAEQKKFFHGAAVA
jgi:hypothetical protein